MWKTAYNIAVLTASDKGARGERVDESGPLLCRMAEEAGGTIVASAILPDDEDTLRAQLLSWCESGSIQLILTTGGTGLSPRDCMPEATLSIATRLAPGFCEAMRAHSLTITNRAMLSRAASVVCKNTLIINMPGSPKAVRESFDVILPALEHALDILCGNTGECARP